jgi:hypothetical protein
VYRLGGGASIGRTGVYHLGYARRSADLDTIGTSHGYILHTVRFNERYVCESISWRYGLTALKRATSEFLEFCQPSILSRAAP